MNKKQHIYLPCIFIFLLLCSYANYQITKFDGRGYVVWTTSLIFIIVTYNKLNLKPYIFNPPVMIWGGLMLYHVCNTYMKKSHYIYEQNIIIGTLTALTLMIFVSYLYNVDRNALFKCLIISTMYYLLIAFIFGDSEKHEGRLSGFIYTTQLGQLTGVTCLIISMFIFYKRKIYLAWLYVFPVFIMLLAGARNGFLMVSFAMVCLAIPYIQNNKKNLFLCIFLIIGFYYVIQDSNILERLKSVNDEATFTTGTIWDSILGDRVYYYVYGYKNFTDNPLTGIGLLNFMDYNLYKYPIHSEIMTHMAEGGIIGLILYLWFKLWYIKHFVKSCGKKTPILNQCFIIFISLAILGLTARIFQYSFFFLLYGIINGEIIKSTKYRNLY